MAFTNNALQGIRVAESLPHTNNTTKNYKKKHHVTILTDGTHHAPLVTCVCDVLLRRR
jgi:hypothetical protein